MGEIEIFFNAPSHSSIFIFFIFSLFHSLTSLRLQFALHCIGWLGWTYLIFDRIEANTSVLQCSMVVLAVAAAMPKLLHVFAQSLSPKRYDDEDGQQHTPRGLANIQEPMCVFRSLSHGGPLLSSGDGQCASARVCVCMCCYVVEPNHPKRQGNTILSVDLRSVLLISQQPLHWLGTLYNRRDYGCGGKYLSEGSARTRSLHSFVQRCVHSPFPLGFAFGWV